MHLTSTSLQLQKWLQLDHCKWDNCNSNSD